MKIKILFLPVSFLIIFSCSNNDDHCTEESLNTISLESEYDCTNTKYDLEVNLSDDFIIIGNQTDFDRLVTGDCHPEIDSSTYDLIIGKKQQSSGNDSIDYQLKKNCETGNYVLKVTFNQNIAAVAPNLTYHTLAHKLAHGKEITVKTESSF